jgi:hypothetical protein
MKYYIFILFIIISCKSISTSNRSSRDVFELNKIADSFVVSKLLYFDSLINSSKIDSKYYASLASRSRVEGNTLYMERLTKINSSGPADHYGRTNVSLETYLAWVKWYLSNKKKLLWDKDKEEVILK